MPLVIRDQGGVRRGREDWIEYTYLKFAKTVLPFGMYLEGGELVKLC